MKSSEFVDRLQDLIKDRQSFIHEDEDDFNAVFLKDIEALRFAVEIVSKFDKGELVEVVHARWDAQGGDAYDCTNCDYEVTSQGTTDYCPSCGAKMDGKDGAK